MNSSFRTFRGMQPVIAPSAYVDPSAVLIGDVTVGEDASIWPMAVARGDIHWIRIGDRTNIQDGSVLHVTRHSEVAPEGFPLLIEHDVTVGHKACLHGCTIGHHCLIGMGAVVLDGAKIDPYTLIAAGSLVPPGKKIEGGGLWLGNPIQKGRDLKDQEIEHLELSARHYAELAQEYRLG